MSEQVLTTGETAKNRKSAKRSGSASKPQEPSSQSLNSPLQHRQMQPVQQPQTTQADKVQSVQELMRGELGIESDDQNTVPQPGTETDAPQTAKPPQSDGLLGASDDDIAPAPLSDGLTPQALAEQLGVSTKKLYEQLQVTTGDGETLSLGQLKDRVQDQETATREIVQREQSLQERESAVLQNQQQLQAVLSDLEGKLSPEVVQQMQRRQQQTQVRERQLMLEAMPELRDPDFLSQFRENVAETLGSYGFQPGELVINDHRVLKVLKDFMATKTRLEKLLAFDPEREQNPPKQKKPQGKQPRKSRTAKILSQARTGTQADKVRGVSALLQNGAK